jgi:hypothetical protein
MLPLSRRQMSNITLYTIEYHIYGLFEIAESKDLANNKIESKRTLKSALIHIGQGSGSVATVEKRVEDIWSSARCCQAVVSHVP